MISDRLHKLPYVGSILISPAEEITINNCYFSELSKNSTAQHQGKKLNQLLADDVIQSSIQPAITAALNAGAISDFTCRYTELFTQFLIDGSNHELLEAECLVECIPFGDYGDQPLLMLNVSHFPLESEDIETAPLVTKDNGQLCDVLESIDTCVLTVDLNGDIERFNSRCLKLFNYDAAEFATLNLSDIFLQRGYVLNIPVMLKEWASFKVPNELLALTLKGELVPVSISASYVVEQGVNGYVITVQDISQEKQNERLLEELAHHDPLTGLANQSLLSDRVERAITRCQRNGTQAALLFIDIDHFKKVNDSLGHNLGDALLKILAEKIHGCVRKSDTVARLSGDQFIALIEDINSLFVASTISEKITNMLKAPIHVDGREIYITVSIGISAYPSGGSSFEALLQQSDTAMLQAKSDGRNSIAIYSDEMDRASQIRLELDSALRVALKENQFTVFFQPLLDLKKQRITGAEALIRWVHPIRGNIPPTDFIPLAEESGLICEIGDWVLEQAALFAKKVNDRYGDFTVAVNISPNQFKNVSLLSTAIEKAQKAGIPHYCLELEITEGLLMEKTQQSIDILQNIAAQGFKISIDDFGTGYSSLAYLRKFAVDTLKIDRSFVMELPSDPDSASISAAIVNLAHTLGLNVIAEGVETEDQLDFLNVKGCEYIQGFHVAKPMPKEEFIEWVENFDASSLILEASL